MSVGKLVQKSAYECMKEMCNAGGVFFHCYEDEHRELNNCYVYKDITFYAENDGVESSHGELLCTFRFDENGKLMKVILVNDECGHDC